MADASANQSYLGSVDYDEADVNINVSRSASDGDESRLASEGLDNAGPSDENDPKAATPKTAHDYGEEEAQMTVTGGPDPGPAGEEEEKEREEEEEDEGANEEDDYDEVEYETREPSEQNSTCRVEESNVVSRAGSGTAAREEPRKKSLPVIDAVAADWETASAEANYISGDIDSAKLSDGGQSETGSAKNQAAVQKNQVVWRH